MEYQGDSTECYHCGYEAAFPDEDPDSEKTLSQVKLFAGILYFTTYQPDMADICNPNGNGFAYALTYSDATAAYDFNTNNNDGDIEQQDVTDRFNKVSNIFGIPSDFAIIIRDGEVGAMSMMGGEMPKFFDGYQIISSRLGLDLYYWYEGNTIQ